MKYLSILMYGYYILFFTSCNSLFSSREFIEEMELDDGMFRPNRDFRIVSGDQEEKRVDWDDVWERTPMNPEQKENLKYKMSKKLSKPTKQNSLQSKAIQWAIENQELIIGMPKYAVQKSWGYPVRIDVAGDPSMENERWAYNRYGEIRYVYFEQGQVKGWASE